MTESHKLLSQIVHGFEALALNLEHAIEVFAQDDSGTVNLEALHRAKDVAFRGAELARNATSRIRRAFD